MAFPKSRTITIKSKSMHKTLTLTLLTGLALGAAGPASAQFIGYFAVSNWTLSNVTAPPGGDPLGGGSADTTGAPNSIEIISNNAYIDDLSGPTTNTDFTITATTAGSVSFDWSFLTTDDEGPTWDPFGYVRNGIFVKLSDDNGSDTQSDSASFSVNVGDVFGFRAQSLDSSFGSSFTTISNFNFTARGPSVPEPGTLALFALGGALGLRRRKA